MNSAATQASYGPPRDTIARTAGNSSRRPGEAHAVEKDMTEGLPPTDTPTHIARRALLARLDTILEELGKPHRSDAGIHNMRKELKRARAALRMLRACIGVVEYRRDNALLRDAARPLTPIRDAKVLLQTLEPLTAKKELAPEAFSSACARSSGASGGSPADSCVPPSCGPRRACCAGFAGERLRCRPAVSRTPEHTDSSTLSRRRERPSP